MKKNTGKVVAFFVAFPFLIGSIIAILFYLYFQMTVFPSADSSKSVHQYCLLVEPGEHFKDFSRSLSNQSTLPFPRLFDLFVKFSGKSKLLKIGEYCFGSNAKVIDVLHAVTEGKYTTREFTIISGKTLSEINKKLLESPGLKHQLQHETDTELAYLLKLPRMSFEGEFLPDTYRYAYPESDLDLLVEAHRLLLLKLYLEWQNRSVGLPYKTPYQALIAASIIEKESADPEDRKLISGVIVNRLNKHMRLQMDPTVIYGLRDFAEKNHLKNQPVVLTRENMRIDTPYNTYLHWGLPPTPICMPSANAIKVALHPEPSEYLYFVAKGYGRHQFSKTLVEQNAAINKYLLQKNREKTHD